MTSDITRPLSNKDKNMGSTMRQEYLQIPIPTQRHERYIQLDTLSISPSQTYPYDSNMGNTFTKPKISSLVRDTFGHIERENYERGRVLRKDRYLRTYF